MLGVAAGSRWPPFGPVSVLLPNLRQVLPVQQGVRSIHVNVLVKRLMEILARAQGVSLALQCFRRVGLAAEGFALRGVMGDGSLLL